MPRLFPLCLVAYVTLLAPLAALAAQVDASAIAKEIVDMHIARRATPYLTDVVSLEDRFHAFYEMRDTDYGDGTSAEDMYAVWQASASPLDMNVVYTHHGVGTCRGALRVARCMATERATELSTQLPVRSSTRDVAVVAQGCMASARVISTIYRRGGAHAEVINELYWLRFTAIGELIQIDRWSSVTTGSSAPANQ